MVITSEGRTIEQNPFEIFFSSTKSYQNSWMIIFIIISIDEDQITLIRIDLFYLDSIQEYSRKDPFILIYENKDHIQLGTNKNEYVSTKCSLISRM
jgi:hypothetical protein